MLFKGKWLLSIAQIEHRVCYVFCFESQVILHTLRWRALPHLAGIGVLVLKLVASNLIPRVHQATFYTVGLSLWLHNNSFSFSTAWQGCKHGSLLCTCDVLHHACNCYNVA